MFVFRHMPSDNRLLMSYCHYISIIFENKCDTNEFQSHDESNLQPWHQLPSTQKYNALPPGGQDCYTRDNNSNIMCFSIQMLLRPK